MSRESNIGVLIGAGIAVAVGLAVHALGSADTNVLAANPALLCSADSPKANTVSLVKVGITPTGSPPTVLVQPSAEYCKVIKDEAITIVADTTLKGMAVRWVKYETGECDSSNPDAESPQEYVKGRVKAEILQGGVVKPLSFVRNRTSVDGWYACVEVVNPSDPTKPFVTPNPAIIIKPD